MSFSVNTNVSSLNGQAQLIKTNFRLEQTLQRLSSGLRINSSADDAAGLAVANRYRMDNAGLQTGIRASNDAVSRLQIEDGALDNISNLLDRALTLATQAASDTFLGSRTTLDSEFQSVLSEITRSATSVGLQSGASGLVANGGSIGVRSVFVGNTQISTAASVTYVSFNVATAVDSQGLGISTQNITSQDNAATTITALQAAVGNLGNAQGTIGAAMNRLQFISSMAQTMSVAVAASESRIRDANMAEEAASMTKFNILNQSGLAALAQSNQTSAAVLSLLR